MAWFLAVMGEKRVLLMGVLYAVTITVALGYNLNAGRTHRPAAKVWVLGGLVCLILAPVRSLWGVCAFFTFIAVMVLVPGRRKPVKFGECIIQNENREAQSGRVFRCTNKPREGFCEDLCGVDGPGLGLIITR